MVRSLLFVWKADWPMKKIPMLEKFAAQSLVEHDGELIFSKERFAELIIWECARIGELKEQGYSEYDPDMSVGWYMRQHFGVDGMSTEDKKTLIKELLGVKNETNQ